MRGGSGHIGSAAVGVSSAHPSRRPGHRRHHGLKLDIRRRVWRLEILRVIRLLLLRKGTNKAEVSRWFRGHPNWTVGTIANLAHALNVDLRIEAIDRTSGEIFTPAGIKHFITPRTVETSASSHTEAIKLIRVPPGTRIGPPVLSAA
jgi:hypothetical protein